jgi:hypothetical protein
MGRELRTRYKIQDTVRVVSVLEPPRDLENVHWAVGRVGLIRRVWFDLFGIGFLVEVCHPISKICLVVECRKVKKVKKA